MSRRASLNFSVAKVIAIFTVLAGHWFSGTILWIPVTFGLFVFAFSSGYFTSKIYGDKLDRARFWRKKLERLGLRYWTILAFLALVVGLRGGTVFHWHTLVHLLGLSGVLNWLAIRNASGLGAGLWFFTLLLIFYFAYPYLARAAVSRPRAALISVLATGAAIYLQDHVHVGHELWLTALGFVLGVMYGAHELRLQPRWPAACAVAGCALLLAANAVGYGTLNTALITVVSIALALWLSKARIPASGMVRRIASLDAYLLEIFLIHTYLFVHPSGNKLLDLAVTVPLVLVAAVGINRLAAWTSAAVLEAVPVAAN
jgi:hypothetical protein